MDRFRGVVEESDMAVVSRLTVRHEYRGGDLGFRLLEASFGFAAQQGVELILGTCGILGELSGEEVDLLLGKSHVLSCRAGDEIIRKGHVSRTLYMLLLEGRLEVFDDGERVARVEEPGALVGEVAFFSSGPRMSDVCAGVGGARVLALSDRKLREIISEHGPVAAKFLHFVARGLSQKLLERAQAVPAQRSLNEPSSARFTRRSERTRHRSRSYDDGHRHASSHTAFSTRR